MTRVNETSTCKGHFASYPKRKGRKGKEKPMKERRDRGGGSGEKGMTMQK